MVFLYSSRKLTHLENPSKEALSYITILTLKIVSIPPSKSGDAEMVSPRLTRSASSRLKIQLLLSNLFVKYTPGCIFSILIQFITRLQIGKIVGIIG